MSVTASATNRIFGLDLMRATAITLVLLGHIGWILPKQYGFVNALLSLFGFLGVEMFFVLSGFLIGSILYRQFTETGFGMPNVFKFLKRRWMRTLPNYFLILLINIALVVFVYKYEIASVWPYFFFVQNLYSPMPAFFPESWSLSIEEFAYLILPLALLVVTGFQRRRSAFALVVCVVYLVFIGTKVYYDATNALTSMPQWNLGLKAVVIYRIDAICTGVLASWVALNYPKAWQRWRWPIALASSVLLFFLCLSVAAGLYLSMYSFYWNVMFLPLISLAFCGYLPLLSFWRTPISFVGKPITTLSLISYSAYLLHYSIVMQFLHSAVLDRAGWAITTMLYLAATLGLSYLLYRFFEKPILGLRSRL